MRKKLFRNFIFSIIILQSVVVIAITLYISIKKNKITEEIELKREENIERVKIFFNEISEITKKIEVRNEKALNELEKIIRKGQKYELDKIAKKIDIDYIFLLDENYRVYDSNFKQDIGYDMKFFGGDKLVKKVEAIKNTGKVLHLRLITSTLTGILNIYSYKYSNGIFIEVATDFSNFILRNYSKGFLDYLTKDFFKTTKINAITSIDIYFHNSNERTYWSLINKKKLEENILRELKDKKVFKIKKDKKLIEYQIIEIEKDYSLIIATEIDFSDYEKTTKSIIFFIIILSLLSIFISYFLYIKTSKNYIEKVELITNDIESLSEESINKEEFKDELDHIRDVIKKVKDNIKKKEEDLIETNKNLEEALALKTAFLANANHELRTPLTGILGMLYILSQSGLTKEQQEYVNIIEESAHNLYNIIKNILTFSKIKTGNIKPETKEINITDFFNETVHKYKKEAEKKGLSFSLNIDTDKKNIITYPTEIREIVIHLLNNSIKFTQKGGITVNVKTEEENNKNNIVIEVSDTGIGIAKEKINFILKEFAQEDLKDTRKYGGLGLGLTIVKEMVNYLSGSTVINSDEKGTSVIVKVPFFIKEKKEAITKIRKNAIANIIAITKDKITKDILTQSFNESNSNYIFIEDPNEVLIYLNQLDFHFLIIDSEIIKEYKGDIILDLNKKKKDIKIILITDFYNEKLSDILYIRGIYKTIKKPVTKEEILRILKNQ